jgi:hypothetical protein
MRSSVPRRSLLLSLTVCLAACGSASPPPSPFVVEDQALSPDMVKWIGNARWSLGEALWRQDQQVNSETGLHSLGWVQVTYRVAIDPGGHVTAVAVVDPPDLKHLGDRFLVVAQALKPLPPPPLPPGSAGLPVQMTLFSHQRPGFGTRNWRSSVF